jgi:hypothetical protein
MEKIIEEWLREYWGKTISSNINAGEFISVSKLAEAIASDIKSKLRLDLDKAIKEGILANARLQTKYEKQLREINAIKSKLKLVAEGVYNETFHCMFKGNCIVKDIKPIFKKYHGKNIRIWVEEL